MIHSTYGTSGEVNVSLAMVVRLADGLGISLVELFSEFQEGRGDTGVDG